MKKAAKRTLGAGVVATVATGALYAVWRAYKARMPAPNTDDSTWEPAPFPFPPIPRPRVDNRPQPVETPPSVEPRDGECPGSHPVKGKLASGVYHVPGGLNYEVISPDRCYIDAAAAKADGLKLAKP